MNEPQFSARATAGTEMPEFLLGDQQSASTESVKSSGRAGRFALGGLVAALAIGGGFAARSALQTPAGPASSDEAVTQFFEALDSDDFVGLAEVVHPAERESIAQPMFSMLDHIRRLEIIDAEGTDPAEAKFVDFQVEGLTYSVEQTGERLHYVTTTGGTVTSPDDVNFPSGPLFDRFDIEVPEGDGTTSTVDLGEEPMRMAIVEDDGSWYVSLWYSVAEDVRRTEGMAFPGLGSGPLPVGAATPDGVMEDMVAAMADLDAQAVMTLLDPEESAVLYDYSALFQSDLDSAMDEIRAEADAEGVSWTLDSVDYDAVEVNGRQIVQMQSVEVSMTLPGEDGEPVEGSIAFDGLCSTVTIGDEVVDSCEEVDDPATAEVTRLVEEAINIIDLSDVTVNAFEKLAEVDRGLTVVERDGRWYLSLMPSMIETANDHLAVLEPEDLVAMGTDIEEIEAQQDRILDELETLISDADFEAILGGDDTTNALGGLSNGLLGESGGATFEPVSPSIGSDDEPFVPATLGDLADVLIESDSVSAVDDYNTYLAWVVGDVATEGFLSAAFVVRDGAVIEVAEFSSPVNPAILDVPGWELETAADGSTTARSEFGEVFTFVGNYVVWSGGDEQSMLLLAEQVALLR